MKKYYIPVQNVEKLWPDLEKIFAYTVYGATPQPIDVDDDEARTNFNATFRDDDYKYFKPIDDPSKIYKGKKNYPRFSQRRKELAKILKRLIGNDD